MYCCSLVELGHFPQELDNRQTEVGKGSVARIRGNMDSQHTPLLPFGLESQIARHGVQVP